jgi:hypothetical protein
MRVITSPTLKIKLLVLIFLKLDSDQMLLMRVKFKIRESKYLRFIPSEQKILNGRLTLILQPRYC